MTRSERDLVDARIDLLLEANPAERTGGTELLGARFDAGLAWVHFPLGFGGLGVAPGLQRRADEVLAAHGVPVPSFERNAIGQAMAAPTIVVHGTEEQQRRLLRPLYMNDEIWCQLFSEPGAGSDLAGLSARASAAGESWVIDGQKVWTTLAHTAKWGLLVARNDATLPKHRGLTCFIVDMEHPGVEVRPLRQLTGEAEFNEVFLSGVEVPDAMRLGAVGDGWRVALTTLMNERVAIGGRSAPGPGSGPIAEAARAWRASPSHDAVRRDPFMRLWIRAEAQRLTNLRAAEVRESGTPGPEGSVAKLIFAELNKAIYELCTDLMGADGMLYPEGYEFRRPEEAGFEARDWRWQFLRARASSIEGGTSEVMRNILGERVLGLPPDPRSDKDIPWSDVPRSP